MSLHRACCCGCPSTLEAIFSGVEAAKCGCTAAGGSSFEYTTLIADGTFLLDFESERTISGRPACDYRYCANLGVTALERRFYSGSTVCAGTPSTTTRQVIDVFCTIWKENGKIQRLVTQHRINCGDSFGFFTFDTGSIAYPGLDRGAAHSNVLTCSTDNSSNGGTGLVS